MGPETKPIGSGEPSTPPTPPKPRQKNREPVAETAEEEGASKPNVAPEIPAEISDVMRRHLGSASDGWAYPSIQKLLTVSTVDGLPGDCEQWLLKISSLAKAALQQMNLQAKKLLSSSLTPNSALLRFAGSANLTVDQVLKKRSELLTTFGLNVISVRPEPGAVVIAVEREVRQVVDIRQVWTKWDPKKHGGGNQDLLIGVRESDGTLLFLSPGRAHAPHTLIAESTGSGKSVLVQNILLAIAATNTPEQAASC